MSPSQYVRLTAVREPATYPDGAADEAVSVVNFENSFKQLVTRRFVRGHLTLQQVHGLWNAAGEVHQSVGSVAAVQSLIAAVNPAGREELGDDY